MDYEIEKYNEKHRQQVLTVWQRSVQATHHFLSKTDFEEIKELVATIDFYQFDVFVLEDADMVIGFIGVAGGKIEMLFIDPGHFGRGHGQRLLNFAVNDLGADKVDVNEQNVDAVRFYQKNGFETFERTSKDDQGRDYPLLRMKLVSK